MFKFFTIDEFDFEGKVVGVRVDINSPIKNGRVLMNERIVQAAKTILELKNKGARVVVLAHQGREGKSDFVSLKEHCVFLEKEIKSKVDFLGEVFSKKVEKKILSLKNGEVCVLENLRFVSDEVNFDERKRWSNVIVGLEKFFDYYVFDAFSLSHRKHASVVGFSKIPIIAGRLMEKEVFSLNKIEEVSSPHVFIFGGAKPDDLIELLEVDLKSGKVDLVLLTGVIAEIALSLKGVYLGKKLDFLEKHGFLSSRERLKFLLDEYEDKIVLPEDLAVEKSNKRCEVLVEKLKRGSSEAREIVDENLIFDVGKKTCSKYDAFLKNAGSIYFKGPAGNFEEKNFELGTKRILNSIVSSSAFTFMGGGHSVAAAEYFGVLKKFSYVSLAGGALVRFLSGKNLYGVDVLEESFEKFEKMFEDFIVIGSNTLDYNLNVPRYLSQISLGEKIRVEDDLKMSVGGGGVNVSICLARLGAKVGYLGKLSEENKGVVEDVLRKSKVGVIDVKLSKKACAKSTLMDTKDKDRVIFTYRGQNSFLDFSDFDVKSFRAKNYYINSLTGKSFETIRKLVRYIKKKQDATVCYNPSSYLIKNELLTLKSFLKYVDILVVNYEEAQLFLGRDASVVECLRELFKLIGAKGVVLITNGEVGAYAYDGSGEVFVRGVKPRKVVDTTGAGDSFGSTFFYFYVKGFGVRKALKLAAKNSSSVVEYKGAQDGLMYYDDLVRR